MKNSIKLIKRITIVTAAIASFSASAQQQMQYFRPDNKEGLLMFETTKNDTTAFKNMKVFVGGNFEMDFQGLRDQNTAAPLLQPPYVGNVNSLQPLNTGFDLPMAKQQYKIPIKT